MKATQSRTNRWLHLRWCHCYQWKNLLDQEIEARYQLEQQHQQQLKGLLSSQEASKVVPLLRAQQISLVQLRQELQQKRLALKVRQAQEMEDFQQQLLRPEDGCRFNHFESLSVLRRS